MGMKLETDIRFKVGDTFYTIWRNKIMQCEVEGIEVDIAVERDNPIKHRIKYYFKCEKENSFIHSYETAPYVYNTQAFATIEDLINDLKGQPIEVANHKVLW